jgi:multidrug transporter EmrE-like cation transporter
MGFLYIATAIIAMTYGQLVVKWQMNIAGALPIEVSEKFFFLIKMFLNPWILSAVLATLITSIAWMAAMTKFDLSFAYPFMGLTFIMVMLLSTIFFQEPLTWQKISGASLILAGIIIGSQG